jgi:hypothetical protein
MTFRLHAITSMDAHHPREAVDGTAVVSFRDLGAVVSEQKAFNPPVAEAEDVEKHRVVVDALFRAGAALPAPYGVVFRSREVLTRWMELHYVALRDALEFVEDRAVARVHIRRASAEETDVDVSSDLSAAASEAYRALRRKAVAAVPLHVEPVTGVIVSGAFLVDAELWKDFVAAVDELRDAHELLDL